MVSVQIKPNDHKLRALIKTRKEELKKNEGEMALLHARVGSRLHAVVRLGVAAMATVLARPVLLRRVVVRRRVAVLLRRSRVPGHRGGREHEHGKRQRHQQPLKQSRHGWIVCLLLLLPPAPLLALSLSLFCSYVCWWLYI